MARYVIAALADAEERSQQERIRLRSLRDASNPFSLEETKFKKVFRLPIACAQYLCETLAQHHGFNESDNIPIHLKILGALHFYCDGGYQIADGGDSLIALSQPSMSRAIDETTNAVIDLLTPTYIKFPMSPEEKRKTMHEFYEMYRMPNTLGAVDGTHISIHKPSNMDPLAPGLIFYNRKGYYSINCQMVTNARGKITAINPNFPGSTHDSAVWQASAIAKYLERQFLQGIEDQWLLGDKGYPLLPWLMTPVAEPVTQAEINYNATHAAARNVVEMTFGRLKNKLRCLHKHRTLHYEPTKAAKITVACCTLYNMFTDVFSEGESEDGQDENNDNMEENSMNPIYGPNYLNMARAKRESLINLFR